MTTNGCRGCCSYPHGPMSILITIFGFFAWSLGFISMYACCYVRNSNVNKRGDGYCYGLYMRETTIFDYEIFGNDGSIESCVDYTSEQVHELMDNKFRLARIFAGIAQPVGFITMVCIFTLGCVAYNKTVVKISSVLMFILSLFKLLELIALGTNICETFVFILNNDDETSEQQEGDNNENENTCKFSTGAGFSIGSSILWFLCGCIALSIGQAKPDPRYDNDNNNPTAVATPATSATATPAATSATATATATPYYAGTVDTMEQQQKEGEFQPPGTMTTTEINLPDGTKKITTTIVNADLSKTITETIEKPIGMKSDVM